jgi:hypothetical protein
MTKRSSKLLQLLIPLLSISVFILMSVIVITLSQGKKIGDDGKLVQTSIIRLNVVPDSEVKAYINDREYPIVNSSLENIDPGYVRLKVSRDGYVSWEKTVSIDAGVVKDLYIQLYPQNIIFERVTDNIDQAVYSLNSDLIFYTVLDLEHPANNGIWKYKISRNFLDFSVPAPVQVAKFDTALTASLKETPYSIEVSRDNNGLLLVQKDLKLIYNYNANQQNKNEDLLAAIGFTPDEINWFRNSESVILKKGKLLFEYEINSKQTTLISIDEEKLVPSSYNYNSVYYIKSNKLYRYLNKTSTEVVLPLSVKALTKALENVYVPINGSNIIILKTDKDLVYLDLDKSYTDIIGEGNFISAAENGRALVFEKNGKLFSYLLEETLDGKSFKSAVYDLGIDKNGILSLQFSPSDKNIVFMQNDKSILVSDFDGQNKNRILKEFKFSAPRILITADSTELYALIEEKNEDNLTTKEIFKFSLEIE